MLDLGAVGWAHLRLWGGWKVSVLLALAYMLGMAVIAALTSQIDPARWSTVLTVWTYGGLVVQVLNVVIFGCIRISVAVRQDVNTGMIESHRLMPLPPYRAVLGYITGGTAQVWTLAAANLIVQIVLGGLAGLSIWAIIIANTLILVFGLMLWMAVMTWSFVTPWVPVILGALGIAALVAGAWILLICVPASWLLLGSIIWAFDLRAPGATMLNVARAVAALIELATTAVLFIAATRKYRDPFRPAFGLELGLPLVALWTLASIVGVFWHNEYMPLARLYHEEGGQLVAAQTGAITTTILLSLLPVLGAAKLTEFTRAQARVGSRPGLLARVGPPATLIGAILLILALTLPPLLMHDWYRPDRNVHAIAVLWAKGALATAVVAVTSLTMTYAVARALHRRNMPALWLILAIFAAIGYWAGPIVLDLARHLILEQGSSTEPLTFIAALSPLGALIEGWRTDRSWLPLLPGLATHLVVGAIAIILWLVPPPRPSPRPQPQTTPPPATPLQT